MNINLTDPVSQALMLLLIVMVVVIAIFIITILKSAKYDFSKWKEKLGIETGQDLLIFCIVMGFASVVLVVLIATSFGFIVPIPY